jgi:hypothetical protein
MNHLAQKIGNPYLNTSVQNLSGESFFSRLLSLLVTVGLVIGSIAFIFMLLIGALQWITSGGDKAQQENARGKITSALIGIIVLFAIFVIVQTVENLFGINILDIDTSRFAIGNQ